jgi:hypothetical protein
MSIKARLQKAERTRKQSNHGGRGRVFVYYAGQDFGQIDGAKVSITDFEATRRDNDIALKVQFRNTGAERA